MGIFDNLFGGGDKQQTQSTTVDPYSKSKPLINRALEDALKAYKGGWGTNIYTGSTVIPYSTQTMSGMNGLQALANSQAGRNGIVGQSKDIISQGGFNDQQLSAMKGLQGAMGQNNALARYLGANGLTGEQDNALSNYKKIANSNFNYSPGFQNVLNASLQDAREGVNANASAAGRYGSGIAQGVMARELGELSNSARLGEYRDWQNRKDAANTSMSNLAQVGVGNRSGLIQQGQGLSSSLFNAGQTGLGNMSTAYQNSQLPYQTLMGIGGMNEDLAGRLKNDELRIFDAKNQSPWDAIGRLMQVANLGGSYSTSKTTSQQPGQNPLLNALGLGLGGLSFLGG